MSKDYPTVFIGEKMGRIDLFRCEWGECSKVKNQLYGRTDFEKHIRVVHGDVAWAAETTGNSRLEINDDDEIETV